MMILMVLRRMRSVSPFVMLVAGLLAVSPSIAQSSAETPAVLLAGACQGCHGVSGAGGGPIPAIARTQPKSVFLETMLAFKANSREATVMGRIARGYTDAELNALATYFGR